MKNPGQGVGGADSPSREKVARERERPARPRGERAKLLLIFRGEKTSL